MSTAALLCAVVFAADNPAQVQAKVLYGTNQRIEQRADIELWISRAVAKTGARLVLPHTGWVALTAKNQRIYTSKQGGFIIDGKATERNGKYEVEIDACDGFSLDQKVTLKPGERRVVKLTDNPAPNNVFIVLEAPLTKKAKGRAEAMKADAKTFRLELIYNGDEDKPFYHPIVSVPDVGDDTSNPFERIIQVKEDEAIRIIDHLARDGFLDNAVDLLTDIKISVFPPTMSGYTMKVLPYYEDLGWGLPMIHRLDALRNVLPDNATKDMDLLLGRLSGLRAQWEAKHPPFAAKVGREGSRIRFSAESGTTIIDIASKFGIDTATIKRESPKWPKSILVRLHLRGLELFNFSNGGVGVEWSVSSTGDNSSRVSLRSGEDEMALDTKSPYHTPVRIVGGNGKIPLKGGYFEVPLPVKMFERNPEEITLEWIDFYRD